jgi:penicillin-binding protein 1A
MARLQGGLGYLPADRLAPRVISLQNAWLMTNIMKDVVTRGTARRARALGREDLAGKTGTTNDWRDAWFSGFNHQLVATVWTGFDGEGTLGRGEEGAAVAVPVWMHFMREALRAVPAQDLDRPGGLIDLKINRYTGTLADPLNPDAIYETFMLQHQPQMPAPGESTGSSSGGGAGGGADPLF